MQSNWIETNLIFTETWLSQNNPSEPLNINGYDLLRIDRDGKRGGGLCVYIKQDIPYKRVLPDNQDKETIWITTKQEHMPRYIPNLTIVGVYHPPQADDKDMSNHHNKDIDTLNTIHPNTGLMKMKKFLS